MRCLLALSLVVLFTACPGPSKPDAGVVVDAGVDASIEAPACSSPKDCKAAGFEGVCRSDKCLAQVVCADDVECGLAESCLAGVCLFTGCTADADCATGRCRADVFACAECGANFDCPFSRPVCDTTVNKCVQCGNDSQCAQPGPAHCDVAAGGCVHCLEDKHCPNGLKCGAGRVCTGAKAGDGCPMGVTCGSDLICVALGGNNTCLPSCSLASPMCPTGEICFKLTFSGGSGLVFDQGGPLGVCYAPQSGLKGYRDACSRSAPSMSVSNCQPNLTCIPDTATLSLCRTFCDLNSSNACPVGEKCHPFPGDYSGRLYGLCYPDNGWGDRCDKDGNCKSGLACTAYEDPSATDDLSTFCQFAAGTAPGLAPCARTPLVDGGVITADNVCASGTCVGDPLDAGSKFYCYSACKSAADCAVGGRTGTCDGDFDFRTQTGFGSVPGCRPSCTSTGSCAAYGSNIVCRSRYTPGYNNSFVATCAPPPVNGVVPAGGACTSSPQCRSGFCLFEDGRAVRRAGTCADSCDSLADCANDGGSVSRTGPLTCAPLTFLGFRGFDGVPNSSDDVLLTARLCGGGGCAVDDDCSTDGGARCVPDADPADAGKLLALRCRPPHNTGILQGGTPCTSDVDCASGVCGTLQAPSIGTGKACFQACSSGTTCPGTSTCRVGGMQVNTISAQASFDSCAP